MKLKKLYSSRDVASMTGLTARQLQWWDRRGVFPSAIPSHKTAKGGFTERRYTPIELDVLRMRFKVRLYEAIEGGGRVTLFLDDDKIYARTESGALFNMLDHPEQPLLMVGEEVRLRELTVRERPARRRAKGSKSTRRS